MTTQTDNPDPSEQMPRDSFPPRLAPLWRDSSLASRRRRRLIRMLLSFVGLTLILIFLVLIGREWLQRLDYLSALRQFGDQIALFEQKNQYLPSGDQVLKFQLHARLKPKSIRYEHTRILDDSPPDTPLAYSPRLNLKFLSAGHAVLERGGRVRWLGHQQLQEKIRQREQHYLTGILDESSEKTKIP